jgi:uncharacterized delta-60 repeat protein
MEKQHTHDWASTIKRMNDLNDRLLAPVTSTNNAPDPAIPTLEYDETFGDHGKLVLRTPAKLLTVATSITTTQESDSRFWVTMHETYISPSGPPNYAAIARITEQGEMDTSFGPNKDGLAQIKFDDVHYTTLDSLHELADGRLFIFGHCIEREGALTFRKSMITRLLPDGLQDGTFGENGVVDVGQAIIQSVRRAFYSVDQLGRILVLAQVEKGGYPYSLLTRLTPEGDLDQTFKRVWVQNSGDLSAAPLDMVLNNENGKITIAFMNPTGIYLICFDSEGKIDREFGEDGLVDLSNDFLDFGGCSFTQGSRHLFLTGNYYDGGKFLDAALANYMTTGVPEPKFNDGKPVLSRFGKDIPFRIWARAHELGDDPYAIKVLGWYERSSSDNYQVVGRYTRDGKPDLTFIEGHAIGQVPVEDYFTYETNFINDTSARFLVAGRSSNDATIFAVKD